MLRRGLGSASPRLLVADPAKSRVRRSTFARFASYGGTASAMRGLPSRSPREGRRLVENTGLEPVTSWLQTRRSPS
jgi:hypothetical protein